MARHVFFVLTNAAPGRDDEYNRWHTEHLGDIVAVPGILSGQRFRLSATLTARAEYAYLVLYEVETDDPKAVLLEIQRRADGGSMVVSSAMAPDLYAACFEPITPVMYRRN